MLCRGLRALHGPSRCRVRLSVPWQRGYAKIDADDEVAAAMRALTVDKEKHKAEYAKFRARVIVAEDHLEAGRNAEAVAEYEAVIRAFPPNFYFSDLNVGLGMALVGLGQHAHALTVFDRALASSDANMSAYLHKGLVQVELNDSAGALATFEAGAAKAKKISEDDYWAQFRIYCGQLQEELGQDDAALATFQEMVAEDADYSQAWFLAGCLLAKREQNMEAIRHFREAIDCTRPWPSAFYSLSRLVADPLEKRRLYEKFVEAQREMAEDGSDGDVPFAPNPREIPVAPNPPPVTSTKH
jgi:tetratricopeptide (TPR) repeat protein